jgi:hypothetical protein
VAPRDVLAQVLLLGEGFSAILAMVLAMRSLSMLFERFLLVVKIFGHFEQAQFTSLCPSLTCFKQAFSVA